MTQSAMRAFGERLIDYAGLFPPAALGMPSAFAEYSRQQNESEAWMVGGFVCPIARIEELATCFTDEDGEVPLVPLTSRVTQVGNLAKSLEEDAGRLAKFVDSLSGRIRVQSMELRLPLGLPREDELRKLMDQACAPLPGGLPLFWEADPAEPLEAIRILATELTQRNQGESARHGMKLRCGGVTAPEFPDIGKIAAMLCLCRDEALPLKFTAGLHHPLRHYWAKGRVWMHGFLNVFFAGMAAGTHGLTARDLERILCEIRRDAFHLRPDEIVWRELRVSTREILEARHRLPAFGSCSVDEPRADLRDLGWL